MYVFSQPNPGNGFDGLVWFRENRDKLGTIAEIRVVAPFLPDGSQNWVQTQGRHHVFLEDDRGNRMELAGLFAGRRCLSADWLLAVLVESGMGPKELMERYVYEHESFVVRSNGRHEPVLQAMPPITIELVGDNNLQLSHGSMQVVLKPGSDGVMAQGQWLKRDREGHPRAELRRFMDTITWDGPVPDPDAPFPGFGAAVEALRILARSPLMPYTLQFAIHESLDTQQAEYVARQILEAFNNDVQQAKAHMRQFPHSEHIIQAIDRLSGGR